MKGLGRILECFLAICLIFQIIIIGFVSGDVEPNNTIGQAEDVESGMMFYGKVNLDPLDVDYYNTTFLFKDQLVKFELYFEGGNPEFDGITLSSADSFGERTTSLSMKVDLENCSDIQSVIIKDDNHDLSYLLIEGEGFYRLKIIVGDTEPLARTICGMIIGSGLILSISLAFVATYVAKNKKISWRILQ